MIEGQLESSAGAAPASPLPELPEEASVASRLRRRKAEVERLFRHRVQQAFRSTQVHDRATLLDHLPQLLDALERQLRASSLAEEELRGARGLSRRHGEQRARLSGYSIEQLLAEYRLFRRVLF
ncbi:MAG TPA: hypothetical protein VND93_31600, partial [Myxococcales bacterium]|nr:hypothetical protein [Myxococcales bacterium]